MVQGVILPDTEYSGRGKDMGFRVWRIRSGNAVWFILFVVVSILWAIIEDWILQDTIEYIRSHFGVDMNIIEVILSRPYTILAVVLLVATIIWILKTGSKDSALHDLHKTLLEIRDIDKEVLDDAMPKILAKENREQNREVWLMVAQGLSKAKHKESEITIAELDSMRIQRLLPENEELEKLKKLNKKLDKKWKKVRLLQTAIIDDVLDDYITRLQRRFVLHDACIVYKKVFSKLKILKLDDYKTIIEPEKITRDALDKAYKETNKRIVSLLKTKNVNNKERLADGVRR